MNLSSFRQLPAALLAAGLAAFGSIRPPGAAAQLPTAATASADGEFASLMTRYWQVWSLPEGAAWDPTPAASLYAKDPGLVFYDILPPLRGYRGWESYGTGIRDNVFAGLRRFTLTGGNDFQLFRRGDRFAVVTTSFHASGQFKDGKPLELDGRLSMVWERADGTWKIVHEHSSAPLSVGAP